MALPYQPAPACVIVAHVVAVQLREEFPVAGVRAGEAFACGVGRFRRGSRFIWLGVRQECGERLGVPASCHKVERIALRW